MGASQLEKRLNNDLDKVSPVFAEVIILSEQNIPS